MSTELLRLTDVHAWYGESHILHGIDLTHLQHYGVIHGPPHVHLLC